MSEIEGTGTPAPDPGTPEFYDLLMDYEEDDFGVVLQRDQDDNLSFSREALDSVMFGVQQFIATRMVRHYEAHDGEMPRKMRIMVSVKINQDEGDEDGVGG